MYIIFHCIQMEKFHSTETTSAEVESHSSIYSFRIFL